VRKGGGERGVGEGGKEGEGKGKGEGEGGGEGEGKRGKREREREVGEEEEEGEGAFEVLVDMVLSLLAHPSASLARRLPRLLCILPLHD